MNQYHDREIKFITRGDDIEMLNKTMSLVHNNEDLVSYLAYLKFEILEQLSDIQFPKKEYRIGSDKGYSWEEVDKILEED